MSSEHDWTTTITNIAVNFDISLTQVYKLIIDRASELHENWRETFQKENGVDAIRLKPNGDGTTGNINVPFNELHYKWQQENLAASKVALLLIHVTYASTPCLSKTKYFESMKDQSNNKLIMDTLADKVHTQWMLRNPKCDYNKELHIPYSDLPETEKAKDIEHITIMTDHLLQLMSDSSIIRSVRPPLLRCDAMKPSMFQAINDPIPEPDTSDEAQQLQIDAIKALYVETSTERSSAP
jgi:hypothetical protein